jgi:tetratricopeptide (TPR) repeat protein
VNRYCFAFFGIMASVCHSGAAPAAEKYWAYDYYNISVTGVGSASRAVTIAHDLHRLDTAVSTVTNHRSDGTRPPTRVYLVSDSDYALIRGVKDKTAAQYVPSAFANDILVNMDANEGDALFGAYFGYTGSVISNFHYPSWYISGLSEVFAASSITRDTVTIGGFNPGRVRTLGTNSLIPMNVFLGLHTHDPELASASAQELYAAQSWFLVHLILIEGQYHDSFMQYFKRLSEGEDQRQAFAASFTVGYDTLDQMLRSRLAKAAITVFKVSVPDEQDVNVPRKLSEAEAKGRFALLAERPNTRTDGPLTLAAEALASDPQDERALGAMAKMQVHHHEYAKALDTAQPLCERPTLSAETVGRCGDIYASLYLGVDKAHPLPLQSAQLLERARGFYDRAVAINPEDLSSWYGMTELLAGAKDVAAAKELLPRARHVWATHPANEALARSLAGLSSVSGDFDSALQFAQVWERIAVTDASRAQAEAYEARLRKFVQSQALLADPPK